MHFNVTVLFILVNILVFISVVLYIFFPGTVSDDSSLRFVAIVFRHGSRSPDVSYVGDPYIADEDLWPDGMMHLMLKGKQEMYALGKKYRDRYKSYVPKYSRETLRINSSGVDRTLMSAAALLAGWFPPEGEEIWSDELIWQPIPIHSIPIHEDYTLAFGGPCPWHASESIRIENEYCANWTESDKHIWNFLEQVTGRKLNHEALCRIYFTLVIEESAGLELPAWSKVVYPDIIEERGRLIIRFLMWNNPIKRVYGGSLLNEVLQRVKDKVDGRNEDLKLALYSSHDLSILSLLCTLGYETDDFFMPSFGASVIFELHESSDASYYMKVFYLNNTSSEPYILDLPVCPNPCSFSKLYNTTEYMRSVDIEKDCKYGVT